METYLLIGLFAGMVMVGVYWGMPESTTGSKSVGRSIFILLTAPFLWPIQISFYAVKLLTK